MMPLRRRTAEGSRRQATILGFVRGYKAFQSVSACNIVHAAPSSLLAVGPVRFQAFRR